MEPRPLTTWEQKERAGLLALETDEWRQKRLIAEDPNTTADVLTVLASVVLVARNQSRDATLRSVLLNQAVLAHSNTPPNTLLVLMDDKFLWANALCCNPVLPMLALEIPTFWEQAGQRACLALLREESISPVLVAQFTRHSNKLVKEAATLHVSLAGEIKTQEEGQYAITQFWRGFCAKISRHRRPRNVVRHYHHTRLAEWGLAPAWASGDFVRSYTLADPNVFRYYTTPEEFLLNAGWRVNGITAFERFIANLHDAFRFLEVHRGGARSPDWRVRLHAALILPLTDEMVVYDKGERWDLSRLDFWNRSPLDLMHHLAHDGNRFVRWAAQTRLANPDFVFTWHDGE